MRNTYGSQDLKERCTRNRRMLQSGIEKYLGNLNGAWRCGIDQFGSKEDPALGSCEDGIKILIPKYAGSFFLAEGLFSKTALVHDVIWLMS